MASLPELPSREVPELKTRAPLAPWAPELADLIVIAPLVEANPCPVYKSTAPPVSCGALEPGITLSKPPVPLSPAPTARAIAPPLPPVAAPVPIEILPDPPELEVPELNTTIPLEPLSPALDDLIAIAPLLVEIPIPLTTPIAPPVAS
jgi:hypothetical protein